MKVSMNATRGGYAPLENAGEFVCECLRDGDRVFPKWGNEVRERVVRCRDCVNRASDPLGEYCTLFDFEDVNNQMMLNGFCAWGVRKED